MKRSALSVADVAERKNLMLAFARAARGSHDRPAVADYRAHLGQRLNALRRGLLEGSYPVGVTSCFRIRDPKPRIINAPHFNERVLHHALMNLVGPNLDKALVDDSFACRRGKGALAAIQRAQHHSRRFAYLCQVDIDGYFANIDHEVLKAQLSRRFKDSGLLDWLARIIDAFFVRPGQGLPIGALTSQHFANFHLATFDRWLLADPRVRAIVRYMDDTVWWTDTRATARSVLRDAREWLDHHLALLLKPAVRAGPCHAGMTFCGTRITPGRLALTRRHRQRFAMRRERWEQAWRSGLIDDLTLQRNVDALVGTTRHRDAVGWRREQLLRRPAHGTLDDA